MTKSQKLNASITIGSVLEQSVKNNIGFLKTGLSSVGSEIKNVERRQKELGRQRSVLLKQGRSVEALDREYEELTRTVDQLRRSQERWNRAAGASRRVGASFSTMVGEIGRNARRVGVSVGLVGGSVFALASSTASLGDDVAKTASKIGIGTNELQELRYAAERSGVASTSLDGALEKMNKNLGEAATGTGAAKDALSQLGLSADDLTRMSPEAALATIADRMQSVETQAEKAAIANDIFGRSGIGMLNMIKDGSEGLNQLRVDARRTGFVLSEQAAKDAEVFQDTLLDTQLVMKGLKNTVGAELLPVVTSGMRSVGDALLQNRDQVKIWAAKFAQGVEAALPIIGEVVVGLGSVLAITRDATTAVANMVGGWENFGVIIGAVLAAKTVASVVKFGGAAFSLGRAMVSLGAATPVVAGGLRAIGVALAANPIGLAVTAIGAAAYLIYDNWEKVGPWFQSLWGDVEGYFGGLRDFVVGIFSADMGLAVGGLTSTWESYKNLMGSILGGVGAVFETAWTNVIKPVTDALGVTEPIVAGWKSAKDSLGTVIDWIAEKFAWLGSMAAPVIDKIRWVKDKGASALSAIGLGGSSDAPAPAPQQHFGGPFANAKPQTNALGGTFGPGWHLTGEKGPELKFESRAGYVANNRAMRQLAEYAERATPRENVGGSQSGVKARLSAIGSLGSSSGAASGMAATVTQNITNHFNAAAGVGAEELFEISERRRREAAESALFDRTSAAGPYGR